MRYLRSCRRGIHRRAEFPGGSHLDAFLKLTTLIYSSSPYAGQKLRRASCSEQVYLEIECHLEVKDYASDTHANRRRHDYLIVSCHLSDLDWRILDHGTLDCHVRCGIGWDRRKWLAERVVG